MKISYNWLKWYVPEAPEAEKLADIFTYHVAEVESFEKLPDLPAQAGEDFIFDIKILPNRAHDLLSHQGIAREIASLLHIKYKDPVPMYKVPESKPTMLIKKIETPKCRRYMGRIIRNIKVGASPEWVVKHLESIGQRSINNIVDATNIVMFDCGQPTHVFDMSKVKDLKLQVRNAKNGEKMTLLGGGEKVLNESMMIIADDFGNALDIAGVKGGKYAELTPDTTDIILEAANFDPVSVRKTAQALGIVTDAKKRFENDLSPELAPYGMRALSALIYEMCPDAIFEDVVDIYPHKQEERKLSFSADKISKILGLVIQNKEIEEIFERYNIEYKNNKGEFEINVPPMRLDLTIEEDIAEEIGRILGYDKVKPKIPKIGFKPKVNETHAKIIWARNKLLADGHSEVINYIFSNKGQVGVLESASDKRFLRTNLGDGLKESLKLNKLNAPLLGTNEVKIFEIGTVWCPNEEIHVAYNEKDKILEVDLDEFVSKLEKNFKSATPSQKHIGSAFHMWSLFPFIARDVAVWVPENVKSSEVLKVLKDNAGDLVIRGPELFDEFKKPASTPGGEGKVSYAFRLVFQSYDRTLKDEEINKIFDKISSKIKENKDWELR